MRSDTTILPMKKVIAKGLAVLAFIFLFSLSTKSAVVSEILENYIAQGYSSLQPLDGSRPPYDIYQRGMIGYLNLKAEGKKINNEKLTLIDFRISSNKKRMWIIDLKSNKVLYHRLVSHGKNTGEEYAKVFSNIKNSNTSSLGFYLTGENYFGKHGLSLRLDGVEAGFNDKARDRAIVMHGAHYVNNEYIKVNGRLGRSFGCPAISLHKSKEIIKGLSGQSVLFIYHPSEHYELNSKYNNRVKAEEYIAGLISPAKL